MKKTINGKKREFEIILHHTEDNGQGFYSNQRNVKGLITIIIDEIKFKDCFIYNRSYTKRGYSEKYTCTKTGEVFRNSELKLAEYLIKNVSK